MKHLKFLLIFLLLLSQNLISAFAQIKIACIGNSITYGTGLADRKTQAYPVKLEALLNQYYTGKEFKVTNYGVPGTTMLKDPNDGGDPSKDEDQWSYWEYDDDPGSNVAGGKEQYDLALASVPDIVIIKLGTNDARGENWRSAAGYGSLQGYGKKNFYNHYTEFINSFRAINPNVIVYICYSLPSLRTNSSFSIEQARVIREEVIPIIKQIAKKNKVHLIDLHSDFYDGVDEGLIIGGSDSIHPNAAGAELIANEVFKMIKMTYKP